MKTPTQLLEESNEFNQIIDFVSEYCDRENFPGSPSLVDFAKLILSHKNKFVDKDWYSAGIMAQRILNKDEIEGLKKKLAKEEQDHYYTRCVWDETTKERDVLKIQVEALKNKIVSILNPTTP